MNKEEKFAIASQLTIIRMKVEAAFSYIRKDQRGDGMRKRKDDILNEIRKALEFVGDCDD